MTIAIQDNERFDEYDKCLKVFCHYCESLVNADDTRLTTDDELMCRECEYNLIDLDSTERG